ncbi:MAG: FAD-dependent oxidoreductase, partial [Dehalococcoidia bacterium]|nr:FAD-dependent oxidoreductase [Dehalococcoidia bacterium]
WVSKAKGGTGMVTTEALFTHMTCYRNSFAFPDALPRFKKAAAAVHEHGAKLVGQIVHAGAQTQGFPIPFIPWAPSPMAAPRDWATPHQMTVADIKEIIASWVVAAKVLREAGLDGVEVMGGHGYLVNQFLSPLTNHRTDQYGGSVENRMRLALETLDAVRAAVGKDWVMGFRVSGDEFVEGGYNQDDMLGMAPHFVENGRADYISVTAGTYRSAMNIADPTYFPLNSVVYLAAAIKRVVNVPVIAKGKIVDPVQAEEILANNQADMVGMGRALMADPDWANKAREGRLDEIRKCICCNDGCAGRVMATTHLGLRCSMNPELGREVEPGWGAVLPAAKKKKVMVIGGGPAGLEAARVAALRGHAVSLYEKGPELGGQVLIAAKAPTRDSFLDLPRYYKRQMELLKVDVHLDTGVTAALVKQANPDAVVVATGSVPLRPFNIAGIDNDNVVEARAVLLGQAKVGQNVVVFANDQHIQGLSVADFLASQGKKVQVLTEEYEFGKLLDVSTKPAIYKKLLEAGVVLTPDRGIREISGSTVVSYNTLTGEEIMIEDVDTVVYAFGGKEDNVLFYALKGQIKELYAVGDCAGVRQLTSVTREAATAARRI